MSQTITWLHLSDLHMGKPNMSWDLHRVIDALVRDLQRMEVEHGLRPDLIFFTGDAAFGQIGNGPQEKVGEQLALAQEFFESVRGAFHPKVPAKSLFLVPGNHDVNRAAVGNDQTMWLDRQSDPFEIAKLMQDRGLQWNRCMERLAEYRSFLSASGYSHLLDDPEHLTYGIIRQVKGLRIGIAGFNSVWSCCRDSRVEKGKLWMGSHWQLEQVRSKLKEAHITIALLHHTPNWLVEPEDSAFRRALEQDFRFILHGHEHSEWVTPGPEGSTWIAAGACYERSDKRRESGYSFVRLDLDLGQGAVWLREYDATGGGWVPCLLHCRTDGRGVWSLSHLSWLSQRKASGLAPEPAAMHQEGHRSQWEEPIDPASEARRTPDPFAPYKGLLPYDAEDTGIFFGRQREIEELRSRVYRERLVVLYGQSGSGKTSLLRAGLVPWFKSHDPTFMIVQVRESQNPGASIRNHLRRLASGHELDGYDSLVDFLNAAARVLDSRLVIILDRFEEFFARLDPRSRSDFIAQLGDLYCADEVPVTILLSLRSDQLGSLSEFLEHIPEVFQHLMYLSPLNGEQAREAIVKPAELYGVRYEESLIGELLQELGTADGRFVIPPQLQIVCGALYEASVGTKAAITVQTYQEMGRASGILAHHLHKELAHLDAADRQLAWDVLHALVTSHDTRIARSADELTHKLDVDRQRLNRVLRKLTQARLLSAQEDGTYELAHDYLTRELRRTPEAKILEQAEELIRQELETWKRLGDIRTFLGLEKLVHVGWVRDKIKLEQEAQELLLGSAIRANFEVDYWLERVDDVQHRAEIVADALCRLSVYPDPSDRLKVVNVFRPLAETRPELSRQVVGCLGEWLSHQAEDVVQRAAWALMSVVPATSAAGSCRLAEALAARIEHSQAAVAYPVAYALGQLFTPGDAQWVTPNVVRPLERMITHPDGSFRLVISYALSRVASLRPDIVQPETIVPLIKLLEDTDPFVRSNSAIAIVALLPHADLANTLGMTESLVQLLGDKDDHVHNVGASALKAVASVAPSAITEQTLELLIRFIAGEWASHRSFVERYWVERDVLDLAFASGGEVVLQRGAAVTTCLLNNENAAVRAKSADLLGLLAHQSVEVATSERATILTALSKDQDADTRAAAMGSLGKLVKANPQLAAPEVLEVLLCGLADKAGDVRHGAVEGITKCLESYPAWATVSVSQPIVALLRDKEWLVRTSAASSVDILVHANSALATQDLLGILRRRLNSDYPSERAVAAWSVGSLAKINGHLATRSLRERLIKLVEEDDSAEVRWDAVWSLGRLALSNPSLANPRLGQLLLALATNAAEDPKVRAHALGALGRVLHGNMGLVTDTTVDSLFDLLSVSDEHINDRVRTILEDILTQSAFLTPKRLSRLVTFLTSESESVRETATLILAAIARVNPLLLAPEATHQLTQLIVTRAGQADTRLLAAFVLGSCKDPVTLPDVANVVTECLGDSDENLREAALQVSVLLISDAPMFATSQLVEAIQSCFHDQSDSVRDSAAKAWAEILKVVPELKR